MSVGSRMNGEHGCEKTMPGHFDLTSPTLTLPVLCTSSLSLCALSGSPIPLSKALFPIPVSTISSICSSLRMPLLAEQTALTSYDLCQQLVHSACLVPALSVGTAYPEHLAPPASGRSSVQRLEGSPAAWVCGIDRAIVPEELEQKCFCLTVTSRWAAVSACRAPARIDVGMCSPVPVTCCDRVHCWWHRTVGTLRFWILWWPHIGTEYGITFSITKMNIFQKLVSKRSNGVLMFPLLFFVSTAGQLHHGRLLTWTGDAHGQLYKVSDVLICIRI